MANDIAIIWDNETQTGDIEYSGSDLVIEDGLTSSVILSLFCDDRSTDDSGITNPDDKRGWWGNLLSDNEDVTGLGSNLWLLSREKVTQETLNLTEQYATDSLQWMIDDGVVASVEAVATNSGNITNPILNLQIKLFFEDEDTRVIKFADLWNKQFSDNYYLTKES